MLVSTVLSSVEYGEYRNRLVIRSIDNTVRYIREVQFPGIRCFPGLSALRVCRQLLGDLVQKSDNGLLGRSLAGLADIGLYLTNRILRLLSQDNFQVLPPVQQ